MDKLMKEKIKSALLEILCELYQRSFQLGYYPAITTDLADFRVFNPVSGTFEWVDCTAERSAAQLHHRFSFSCEPTGDGMRFEVIFSAGSRCEVLQSGALPFAFTLDDRKSA